LSSGRISIGISVDKLVVLRVELLGGLHLDILIVVALAGGHSAGNDVVEKRRRC
jgi:hypothetical protein